MTSDQDLIDAATEARDHAYAPYSSFRVGAAVLLADDRVFSGVNVENCSYGLTVCAERHAVAAAARGGAQPGEVTVVAIVADAPAPATPCGACRQVLAEFAAPDCRVLLYNVRDGAMVERKLTDFLPHAFERSSLATP